MPVAESTPLLTDIDAAKLMNVSQQTLANWRCTGKYDLPFIRVGRTVRYRREDLERWLRAQTIGGETLEND